MRGGSRGGQSFNRGGRGGGSGGFRGRGNTNASSAAVNTKTRFADDDNDTPHAAAPAKTTAAAPAPAPGPAHVTKTVLNASGSEVPQRLNNKVFIDGLPFHYSPKPGEQSLEDQLAQFAQDWKVGRVMHLSKKDGQGFGYLAFRSPNSVEVAVRVLNGRKFLGRHLRVEAPKPREEGGDKSKNNLSDAQGLSNSSSISSYNRQILLSDLAKMAQPEIIREVLRDVAPQMEEKIIAIKMCGGNRKAFLTLRDEADVEPAVRFLNGFSLFGRNVCAQKALPPGSLPYSKARPLAKPATTAAADPQPFGSTGAAAADDDEVELVPLGATATHHTSDKNKSSSAKQQPAAAAAIPQSSSQRKPSAVAMKYDPKDHGPREIYVGNISDSTTAAQLRTHFSGCGVIHQCELMYNPATKLPLGIAKIEFAAPASAAVAQQNLHGSRLNSAVLRVDRGAEISQPLAADTLKRSMQEKQEAEADFVDEDAMLLHHGVRNKKKYFEGTSFEEVSQKKGEKTATAVAKKKKNTAAKKTTGEEGGKRPRDDDDGASSPRDKKLDPKKKKSRREVGEKQ